MAIISKHTTLEWGIYLSVGMVGFMFLFAFFMQFMLYDISVYIKFPLSIVAVGITLYTLKNT